MTLVINDIEQDEQLDRAAMKTIAGGGLLTMRQWRMGQQYYDQNIDSTKSQYEASKEFYKLASRILNQHSSRQSSFIRKITS